MHAHDAPQEERTTGMVLGALVCAAFYVLSAAPALRAWEIAHYDPRSTHDFRPPAWWNAAYAPVRWLVEQPATREPTLWFFRLYSLEHAILPPVRTCLI